MSFRHLRLNSFLLACSHSSSRCWTRHLLERYFSTTISRHQFNRAMTLPSADDNASKRPSQPAYTHFIAFPLHCSSERRLSPAHERLKENLQILEEKLNEDSSDGKQKWRMKSFNGLHITLYLLHLSDKEDQQRAIDVLNKLEFNGGRSNSAEQEGSGSAGTKEKSLIQVGGNIVRSPLKITLSTLQTFHPPTSPKSKITLHAVPSVDFVDDNDDNNKNNNVKSDKSKSIQNSLTHLHSIIHSAFDKQFPSRETRPWVPHVTVAIHVPSSKRDKSSKSKRNNNTDTFTTDAQGNYLDERMIAVDAYNQQAGAGAKIGSSNSGLLVSGLEVDRVGLYEMGAEKEVEVLGEDGCVVIQGGNYRCVAERTL